MKVGVFFADRGLCRSALLSSCTAALLSLGSVSTAWGDESGLPRSESAMALVKQMSEALRTLNYEGVFVHIQGNNITSMHILHASDERGELERLRSLDGEAREVIRDDTQVTCIWPASQSVVVNESKPRDLLPAVSAELASNTRYRFSLGHQDRVAGLSTHVVNVQPIDEYRYGYRFWIDADKKMLLRSMLLDGRSNVLEQVMFTDIQYHDSIDNARFDISPTAEQTSWLKPKKAKAKPGLPALLKPQEDRIRFRQLPAGYKEVSETYSRMPINEAGPVSHVMLSDGMASVSVYVEYIALEEQNPSLAGLSSMGAVNAFGLSTDSAFITAVGEVPVDTVRAIALAVLIQE